MDRAVHSPTVAPAAGATELARRGFRFHQRGAPLTERAWSAHAVICALWVRVVGSQAKCGSMSTDLSNATATSELPGQVLLIDPAQYTTVIRCSLDDNGTRRIATVLRSRAITHDVVMWAVGK